MRIQLPADAVSAITSRIADPDVQELAAEAVGTARMAIDKVLANQVDPSYRLPDDPGSLERRLLPRVRRLSPATRTALGEAARSRLRPGADPSAVTARTALYGVVGALDPRPPVALVPAAGTIEPPPATSAVLGRAARRLAERMATPVANPPSALIHLPAIELRPPRTGGDQPAPPAALVPAELRLEVTRVDPVRREAPFGEVEGLDEIAVGAVVLDPVGGRSTVVGPIQLGQFDQVARQVDATVCAIPLRRDANVEQPFLVNLFVAEIDFGGFAAHLEESGHLAGDSIGDLVEGGIARIGCELERAGIDISPLVLAGVAGLGIAAAISLGLLGGVIATIGSPSSPPSAPCCSDCSSPPSSASSRTTCSGPARSGRESGPTGR